MVLPAELPYQSEIGSYIVTVQIISPLCGENGCYVATSPVFHVVGKGFGRWIVVTVLVLILMFLLSFTIMALIIRSQAEVASKKLWCRPHLLLMSCPHSASSLSFITCLSSFLHHTAAITTTSIHSHLADADPYQWTLYELRTANKVVFLVPPAGKTVAKFSHVPQQWRLGVLCFSSTHGALSDNPLLSNHRQKFAVAILSCSGPVPPELAHLQQFYLAKDMVPFVTWLHDGSIFDKWFLWRPLVTHREATSSASHKKRKKNSLAWSGFKKMPSVEAPEDASAPPNSLSVKSDGLNATRDAEAIGASAAHGVQCGSAHKTDGPPMPGNNGKLVRPPWADEIFAEKEERANLPVIQNAFAPSFVHLQAAMKVVELEEASSKSEKTADIPQTKIVQSSSSSNFLKKLFHKAKAAELGTSLDEGEQFSLCDNSASSNITASSATTNRGVRGLHHSTAVTLESSASSNTLNNILPLSMQDGHFCDTAAMSEGSDVDVFDATLPGLSDLQLLGENEIALSPFTETSSCQAEEEDDDFTAMLFGGSVAEE